MKRFWKLAGIATLVVVLGVAMVGAVAYAQDDGEGFPFDFGQRFKEALVDILGIDIETYDAAVEQAQERVVDEAYDEGWLTEDQAEMLRWRMDQAPGFGMRGMGKGFFGIGPGMPGCGPGDNLLSIAAKELDMSLTDLLTELQAGKSIAEVAGDKAPDIVDAYLAELKAHLDEAVAEGKITQKQADYHLEQAEERMVEQLDHTWEDGFHGFRGGGRPGRMRGFPGQEGA